MHMHPWPQFLKRPKSVLSTAASRSASSATITGLLPPSSNVTRFRSRAATSIMCFPVSLSPVKDTFLTLGFLRSSSPTTPPGPGTTLNTPFGRPASDNICAHLIVVNGVELAGLITMASPDLMEETTFAPINITGLFHGTIPPTTPTGSFTTSAETLSVSAMNEPVTFAPE